MPWWDQGYDDSQYPVDTGAYFDPLGIFGVGEERDRQQQRRDAAQGRAVWAGLEGQIPGEGDLAVDYGQLGTTDEYGGLIGGPSEWQNLVSTSSPYTARALDQLAEWSRGGMTAADRAVQQQQQAAVAQQAGAQRQALQQQMEARGMGSSGATLAGLLGNQQGLTAANANASALMQQAIQQRALDSLAGMGSLGESVAGRADAMSRARANALDDFNQRQLAWRRGRQQYNTGARDRSAESRADAARYRYGARERIAAGMTNQYQNESSNRRADQERRDRQRAQEAGAYGTLLKGLASL